LPDGELFLVPDVGRALLDRLGLARRGSRRPTCTDREAGTATLLYRSRPSLPSEHLALVKPVRYPARDGLSIPAYLTLPRGVAGRNLPTVILPHGGPWARDLWGYDPYAQFLANRGYAVLQPNFRGSTGYGKKFLNAGNRQWGIGSMQHDISDGVAYLVKEGIADPKRVGIFGGSYGGYATLAGLAFTPDLYAAGVSYADVAHQLGRPDPRAAAGGPGGQRPPGQQGRSEQIVVSLRDRGMAVGYLLAPDEGHGFAGRENRLAVAAAMEQFFATPLGGRCQDEMPADVAARLAALTVDPKTVVVTKPPAGGAAMAEAMVAAGRGEMLAPATFTYRTTVKTMGREQQVVSTRSVTAATFDGRPVWRIVDAAEGPITAADTLEVDRATLLPVRRDAGGGATVTLRFTQHKVTGKLVIGPQTVPVDVTLDGAVFSEGAGRDVLLASLPLALGYEASLRMFALLSQKPVHEARGHGEREVTTGAARSRPGSTLTS
jgi:dienelactone hydrolase